MPKRKCSTIDLSVGQRMKYYRVKCEFTQQQVADILNINRTTYTKYETGVSEPSHALLGKICKILGVDYNTLLGGADPLEPTLEDSGMGLNTNMLNNSEKMLIAAYRTLPAEEQKVISEYVNNIIKERSAKFL